MTRGGRVSRTEGNADPTHRFTGKELDPETGLMYYGGRKNSQWVSRKCSSLFERGLCPRKFWGMFERGACPPPREL